MAGGSIFDQPAVPRLSSLLREVREGLIQVPEFQRDFVWTDQQRLDLMDSVDKGMPIGSLLVWRTTSTDDLRTKPCLGPFELNGEARGDGSRTYLLDGLQRVTTLYCALSPPGAGVSFNDLVEQRWPIFYDLASEDSQRFRLPSRRRGWQPPSTWLPLSSLYSPAKLYAFQRELLAGGGPPELAEEAERVASRFKDYLIPVVPVSSNDLNLVTESFQRINSSGTKMGEADMVRALTYADDFDLEEELKQVLERLGPQGWGDLGSSALLGVIKVAWELDVYRADPATLQVRLRQDPEALRGLPERLEAPITFLRESCGVFGPRAMPYTYQLVALAEASRRVGAEAFEAASAKLSTWFFQTTYSGWFTGQTGSGLRAAIDDVCAIIEGSGSPTPVDLVLEVRPHEVFRPLSVRTQAFLLQFALNSGVDSETVARDYAEWGTHALPKILKGQDAHLPGNRTICAPHDQQKLERALEALGDEQQAIYQRHVITPAALERLRAGDESGFVEQRQRDLDELERGWVEALGLTWIGG